jgi:hypothetical protein
MRRFCASSQGSVKKGFTVLTVYQNFVSFTCYYHLLLQGLMTVVIVLKLTTVITVLVFHPKLRSFKARYSCFGILIPGCLNAGQEVLRR